MPEGPCDILLSLVVIHRLCQRPVRFQRIARKSRSEARGRPQGPRALLLPTSTHSLSPPAMDDFVTIYPNGSDALLHPRSFKATNATHSVSPVATASRRTARFHVSALSLLAPPLRSRASS